MFAWILNTNPEKPASVGATARVGTGSPGGGGFCTASPVIATRGSGGGASRTNASSSSRTPKLFIADPKKSGVCFPAR